MYRGTSRRCHGDRIQSLLALQLAQAMDVNPDAAAFPDTQARAAATELKHVLQAQA